MVWSRWGNRSVTRRMISGVVAEPPMPTDRTCDVGMSAHRSLSSSRRMCVPVPPMMLTPLAMTKSITGSASNRFVYQAVVDPVWIELTVAPRPETWNSGNTARRVGGGAPEPPVKPAISAPRAPMKFCSVE